MGLLRGPLLPWPLSCSWHHATATVCRMAWKHTLTGLCRGAGLAVAFPRHVGAPQLGRAWSDSSITVPGLLRIQGIAMRAPFYCFVNGSVVTALRPG